MVDSTPQAQSMTPETIAGWLASDNIAERKKGQQHLKAGGFYTGPIDGKVGPGTTDAVAGFRQWYERKQERENATPYLDAAREYGPLAAGLPAGYYLSGKLSGKLDDLDRTRKDQLSTLAQRSDLDPKEADRVARRRGLYARGPGGQAARFGKRLLLPGAFLGMSEFTRDQAEALPEDDPLRENVLEPLAIGERYAAAGATAQALKDAATSGEKTDAVDEATLRSRARETRKPGIMARVLMRNRSAEPQVTASSSSSMAQALADSERAPSTKMRNSDRVYKAAQAARVPGRANMNTTQRIEAVRKRINDLSPTERADVAEALGESRKGPNLTKRITNALDRVSKPGVSAIAGAMAYDAIRGDAEARPVEAGSGQMAQSGPSMAEALAGATAAAGGTYASMKGTEKLGAMASRYAPGVARVAGRAFPPAAAALTAYDLYNLAQEHQPETEAGTGRVARREPTPRELNAKQLRQRHLQHRAMLRALKEQQR